MGTFDETAIVDYRLHCLPTNKLPFPFFIKQTETLQYVFSLQQTNESYRFPLVPFSVYGISKTWRHGHKRHGNMERWTRRHGNMEA
jgi:hypothetical protein